MRLIIHTDIQLSMPLPSKCVGIYRMGLMQDHVSVGPA